MPHALAKRVRWLGMCMHPLCVARGRLWHPRPAVVCRVVLECLGAVALSQCVAVAEPVRLVSACALLHVNPVVLATDNLNWGRFGAESVAELLHHAPVLQNVWIDGTVACTRGCRL